MAMNMDNFSTSFEDNAPLSKRRRFAPAADFTFPPNCANGMDNPQASDSPLMQQLCGKTPTQQEIESELLQVGMRIRKSVADGYKNSPHIFTPRPFFNMHRLSPATQAALTSGALDVQPISTATFCGISLAALAHIQSKPVEEPKLWQYSTSHKRGYEGDSDSDDQEFMPQTPTLGVGPDMVPIPVDYFNIDFEEFGEVSPMTQVNETLAPHLVGRRIAKPRARRQQPEMVQQQAFNPFAQIQLPQQSIGASWMGHRRMTSCGVEASMMLNDFAEAPFLQRREDVDMDCS